MRLRSCLLSLFTLLAAAAWSEAPFQTVWSLEVGGSQLVDTYLSPNLYNGYHLGLDYDWRRAHHGLHFALNGNYATNPAGNATMLSTALNVDYRLMWSHPLPHSLRLRYGGIAALHVGGLLAQLGSNNPAQGQAWLTLGPRLELDWHYRRLGLGIAASTPLIGAFFMPDYGELYYEIALGNRADLLHVAHPGSFRRLNLDLYASWRIASSRLRLGYRADLLSAHANRLTSRQLTNSLYIGLVCNFIPWKGGKK